MTIFVINELSSIFHCLAFTCTVFTLYFPFYLQILCKRIDLDNGIFPYVKMIDSGYATHGTNSIQACELNNFQYGGKTVV